MPTPEGHNAGDAFARLYEDSFDRVYGFVLARVGDPAAAEEILQETYAAAWAGADGFEGRSRDTTWVTAIARHKIADYYRRAIRRRRHEAPGDDAEAPVPEPGPEDAAVGAETRDHVAAALASLRPDYRYALVMKYLYGYSLREIAAALHKTPKSVDGILQRAKAGFIRRYRRASKEDNRHE